MLKVAIATSSQEKIKGILKGFSRFFQVEESQILFAFTLVESGVSEQPFDAETYIGAQNRVDSIKTSLAEEWDFYVSCEAGIESFAGQYFNVQVVCIFEAKNQRYFFGKSAGWQLPSEDIERIKKSNLDSYLRAKGIQSIQELLGSAYSRRDSVAQATELALLSQKLF